MKEIIILILGMALFTGAIATATIWFPYQLPAAMIGAWLIGISLPEILSNIFKDDF